ENATEAYRSPSILATRFISLATRCMSSGARSCRNRGCSPHRVSTSSPATVAITLTNLISVPVGPWSPGVAVGGGGAAVVAVATGAAVQTAATGGVSPAKMALMAGITALAQSVAAEDT